MKIIARSVSKLQCILKCRNKAGCVDPVFRPLSEGINSVGTCYYSSTTEGNHGQELTRDVKGSRYEEVLVFEEQIAIPSGTSGTADLRDFCK